MKKVSESCDVLESENWVPISRTKAVLLKIDKEKVRVVIMGQSDLLIPRCSRWINFETGKVQEMTSVE
jgi:Ca2+-transporting ATPase